MEDLTVIKIVFGTMLSIGGFVLLFLSFKLYYKYLIQEKLCTAKVKGIVKGYTLATRGGENSGICLPIVCYKVDGKEYRVVGPEYKSYKIITTSNPLKTSSEIEYYEYDNQKLVITQRVNSFVRVYKNPMREIYPKDSEIDVFYYPKKPKISYVLRYCNRKWSFWLTFISSIIVLGIDVCTLLLI